tara:strand:- start:88 stop:555 length:468 start_codon:yes stop_codon:yes gene_type:complete
MSKSKSISKANNKELTLTDTEQNTFLATIYDGGVPSRVIKDTLKISSMTFYKYLEKNPKFKEEFNKAQEIGIKTLVEKMLEIFNTEHMDLAPNELMFLREKQAYLKWIAPRISSLFQEKQKIDVKSDSSIRISWESEPDLIDVSTAETVPTPPKD